jgi:hypothetical protein
MVSSSIFSLEGMETVPSFGNAKGLHARRRRGFNARERSEEAMMHAFLTCGPFSQHEYHSRAMSDR